MKLPAVISKKFGKCFICAFQLRASPERPPGALRGRIWHMVNRARRNVPHGLSRNNEVCHHACVKAGLIFLAVVATLLSLPPAPGGEAQAPRPGSPALQKIADQLQAMIADHPKRAAIGVVSAEIPERLASSSNRARSRFSGFALCHPSPRT